LGKNQENLKLLPTKPTHPRQIFRPPLLPAIAGLKASNSSVSHVGWLVHEECEPEAIWPLLALIVRQKLPKVGLRGDFSFLSFLCVVDKEKINQLFKELKGFQ
jgi:hypothetical protein